MPKLIFNKIDMKYLLYLFSPTRGLIDWLKGKYDNPDKRGVCLQRWNLTLFFIEVFLSCILIIASFFQWGLFLSTVSLPFLYYAVSRCIEIIYAFYNDALVELDNEPRKSNLKKSDKVRMAMKSYVGLIINFAFIFYFTSTSFFEGRYLFNICFTNFFDALYFSLVTITTIGYGEIVPEFWLSKLVVMVEVLAGFLLITVAIGTYLGIEDKETGEGKENVDGVDTKTKKK